MKNKRLNRLITVLTIISFLITLFSAFPKFLLQLYFYFKFDMDISDAAAIGVIGALMDQLK